MRKGTETCDDGSDDDIGCALGCLGVNPLYTCSYVNPHVCVPKCGDGIVIDS